jgi:hypothetical protein
MRSSGVLSSAAPSSAASPARARLQTRQKRPSVEFSQQSGWVVGWPSMRLADTPQPLQVHLLAVGSISEVILGLLC